MGRRRAADSAGNLQAGGRPCFFPDGTLVGDFPCFPEADESMCCWANHTCMSNGYCRFPDNDMPGQMRYIRGSCTDREWRSGKCPQQCRNVDASGACPIADCLDGNYCCATDDASAVSGACCSQQNSNLYLFPATVGTTVTVIGAGGPASPETTTTYLAGTSLTLWNHATASPTTSPSSNSKPVSSVKSGTNTLAIGLGAGLGGGLLSICLVLLAVWMYYKRKKVSRGDGTTGHKEPIGTHGPGPFQLEAAPPPGELHG